MPAKILFKYTSRSRVDNFFRGLDSIVSNLANKEDYYIQCTFDENDSSMNNEEVIERLKTYKKIVWYFGVSNNKIHAINSNLDKLTDSWDILFCMSDDMVVTQYGFDDLIRAEMTEDTDMVLHFKDANNGNKLMTLSIIGRTYFERTGLIYSDAYISLYCDLEAQEVAILLGKYKYIPTVIFQHLHPAYNKAPTDEQYKHTESFYGIDGQTYFKRKENNFGL